jgi:tetratricopeptide (TPR) repeat protein
LGLIQWLGCNLGFINRGTAYTDLEQFEKAIQDYNQAIELNPKDARTFNNRGLICISKTTVVKSMGILWV